MTDTTRSAILRAAFDPVAMIRDGRAFLYTHIAAIANATSQ